MILPISRASLAAIRHIRLSCRLLKPVTVPVAEPVLNFLSDETQSSEPVYALLVPDASGVIWRYLLYMFLMFS